jgi:hypothetical protein
MRVAILLVCGVLSCASSHALAAPPPDEVAVLQWEEGDYEPDIRMKIMLQSQAFVKAGLFSELDRFYDHAVARQLRTPSGLWVSGIYCDGVLANMRHLNPPKSKKDWQKFEAISAKWAKDSPKSALARIAHASAISSYAWSIRGEGYAGSVPEKAWKPFYQELRRAVDYLEAEKAVASRSPAYYDLMIGLLTAMPGGDPSVAFEEGVTKFPGYYPSYFSMLENLLPKWHGDAAKIEKFARNAVERTSAIEGKGMYARIYWYASQTQYGNALFDQSDAQWPAMREGFEDVIARYPDQWNLNNYAKFACDAGDVATLSKIMGRLRNPIDSDVWGWGAESRYEKCLKLSKTKVESEKA